MDGVGRLWRCGLSVFEPPGVPGSDRLGCKKGLDGEGMTAADHPGEVTNDHRRIETSDRGGFGDGEAAVNQARGPLLGRHVLRCRVGAGLRGGRDHHSPGSRRRDGIARLVPGPDGIRLGGSLALPARRSGKRLGGRSDCVQQCRSVALDPGSSQSLDPGQRGRGRGSISYQGFEGLISEDAVGRLLELACQVGPQRLEPLPQRIACQFVRRGLLWVSADFLPRHRTAAAAAVAPVRLPVCGEYCRRAGAGPAGHREVPGSVRLVPGCAASASLRR